jgi:hypothetical protein
VQDQLVSARLPTSPSALNELHSSSSLSAITISILEIPPLLALLKGPVAPTSNFRVEGKFRWVNSIGANLTELNVVFRMSLTLCNQRAHWAYGVEGTQTVAS